MIYIWRKKLQNNILKKTPKTLCRALKLNCKRYNWRMTEQTPQKPKSKKQLREEKLAQALRDNLRRRKENAQESQNKSK